MAASGRVGDRSMIETGSSAPDVRLSFADGDKPLSAYRGHPLVLYFYPKDDTSGCTREAQDFTALAAEFAALGCPVIGVSRDSLASHGKFAGKYELAVSLASDGDGQVTEAFGVWVEKSMYGKKYMGIERATFLLDGEGRVARIWRKVKVPNHAQEVLDAVRALPGR